MPKFVMGPDGQPKLATLNEGGKTTTIINPETKKAQTIISPLAPIKDLEDITFVDNTGNPQYYQEPSNSMKKLSELFTSEQQEHLQELTAQYELSAGMLADFAKIRDDFANKVDILDDSGSMQARDTGVYVKHQQLSRAQELIQDAKISAAIDIALGVPNLVIKSLNGYVNYSCKPKDMSIEQRKQEIITMEREINKLKPSGGTPLNRILGEVLRDSESPKGKTLITVSTDGEPSDFPDPTTRCIKAGYTNSNNNTSPQLKAQALQTISDSIQQKISAFTPLSRNGSHQDMIKYSGRLKEAREDLQTLQTIFREKPAIAELFTLITLRDTNKSHIHFSACTGDDNAVGYLNIADRYIPGISTTDDKESEIKEMKHFQGGLFPAENMVIPARKLGFIPEIDHLDEAMLDQNQLSDIVGSQVPDDVYAQYTQQADLAQSLDIKCKASGATHPLDAPPPKYQEKYTPPTFISTAAANNSIAGSSRNAANTYPPIARGASPLHQQPRSTNHNTVGYPSTTTGSGCCCLIM